MSEQPTAEATATSIGGGAAVPVLAALSTLVLAAHFLRDGNLPLVVVLIAIVPLVWLQRRWVPRVFQVVLGLGSLEWLRTLLTLRDVRQAMGQPHGRMVAILGAVALLAAVTASLFELPRVRSWYRRANQA